MKKYMLLIYVVFAGCLFAKDDKITEDMHQQNKQDQSENILEYNDEKFQLNQEARAQNEEQDKQQLQKKSGIKATLLSALIPGAGEYYAESYWKSALFAAVEVVAWAGYLTYEDKGDTKDVQMRRLGDEGWSEQRYWTKVYILAGSNWSGTDVNFEQEPEQGTNVLTNTSIEENMSYLRALEAGTTDEIPNGFKRFTHTLPETKTQQYYEMIYKYLGQFGAGWVELGDNWAYYDGGANLDNLTPDVSSYRSLRNKSNDFYSTAKTMATLVLLNHVASAFDAAFTVKSYNKQVNYSLYAGQKRYAGEKVTTYGIALSW
jgi:hypothetical protein